MCHWVLHAVLSSTLSRSFDGVYLGALVSESPTRTACLICKLLRHAPMKKSDIGRKTYQPTKKW